MQYRKLGKTALEVGIIGLGTEFLWHEPQEIVTAVVHEALDHDVNYFDLWMPSPEIRDYFGKAVKGKRDKAIIAGHLGSTLKDGQYFRTRDLCLNEAYFYDLLKRLQTDYVDLLMLHFIDEQEDFNQVFETGGVFELALRLQREGKARYIGMSSHKVPVSLQAVRSGKIDLLMFPINPAFDSLAGDIQLDAYWQAPSYHSQETLQMAPERKELYHMCEQNGVGIVAMKPYAGGWLFNNQEANFINLTPIQCLSYCLSQPGVITVVPGCKNISEMKMALAFLSASDPEKDFSSFKASPKWNLKGTCMYCNHCLPCLANIDIGSLTRILDTAKYGVTDLVMAKYRALSNKAADCIKCGSCMSRCPFDVDIMANIDRATELFGS
jgi:predicted aldo/keto reductase-like oxidoreductase